MKLLSSLRFSVVLLLMLSVLVVWGTLYQADHGLYAAQQRFYRSYVFFVKGVVPVPGTQLVMALLFLNLLSGTLLNLRFRWSHIGSILTHVGLLVLLVGGFIIGLFAQESRLTLEEGEGSNVAVSYHDWEISIWEADSNGVDPQRLSRQVTAISCLRLMQGDSCTLARPQVKVDVLSYHPHASPLAKPAPGRPAPVNATGIKGLAPSKRQKEPSANIPGCLLRVSDASGIAREILLYGRDREETHVEIDGKTYAWALRRLRHPLPFTLVLKDFQREMYALSSMARRYSSDVTLHAGGLTRDARISMNQPLHYRGFTLYQSSYQEMGDGREFSTLAVVANHGRYIPYVGTGVVFLGMLMHFVMALYGKRVKHD